MKVLIESGRNGATFGVALFVVTMLSAATSLADENKKAETDSGSSISDFSEGMAITYSKGPKGYQFGYIDNVGKVIVSPQFDEAMEFAGGLAAVRVQDKWGYIDKTGKMVIQAQFESAVPFSDGLAAVQVKGKWGYIDKEGKVIIEPRFDDYSFFTEGLAVVVSDCQYGYQDSNGRFVKVSPEQMKKTENDIIAVDCKYGYMDKTGKMAIAAQFDQGFGFSDGLAAVQVKDKWGYIDKTGKFIIPAQFDELNQMNKAD